MTIRFRWLGFILCLLPALIVAQASLTPLERCDYKKVTTHDDLLTYIKDLAAAAPGLKIETIGTTVAGRVIPSVHVLPRGAGAKMKVLLLCQQHGNEPSGKEAALMLLKKIAEKKNAALYAHLDLTIIPSVNPDGNEAGKRPNANKADLNRDHLVLSQPETRAVRAAFLRLQPEVTLDVHEFSAYRKEFLAAGYVRAVDEQFGAPTNLNVPASIREYGLTRLFPFLEAELSKQKVRFANYLKMNEPADTARPSTTSIDDGRQSFAILNTFSFILEGKNGRSFHDDLQRRTENQLAAIDAFLRFANDNSKEIRSLIAAERKKLARSSEPVVVQMDYLHTVEKIQLAMESIPSGTDTTVAMKYAPLVTPMRTVQRPSAYLIPQEQTLVIAALERLGIRGERIVHAVEKKAEILSITDVKSVWMENKPFIEISTFAKAGVVKAAPGDFLVTLNQPASTLLVIALEPASMWGLAQEDEFSALRQKGTDYPVYRIMK